MTIIEKLKAIYNDFEFHGQIQWFFDAGYVMHLGPSDNSKIIYEGYDLEKGIDLMYNACKSKEILDLHFEEVKDG